MSQQNWLDLIKNPDQNKQNQNNNNNNNNSNSNNNQRYSNISSTCSICQNQFMPYKRSDNMCCDCQEQEDRVRKQIYENSQVKRRMQSEEENQTPTNRNQSILNEDSFSLQQRQKRDIQSENFNRVQQQRLNQPILQPNSVSYQQQRQSQQQQMEGLRFRNVQQKNINANPLQNLSKYTQKKTRQLNKTDKKIEKMAIENRWKTLNSADSISYEEYEKQQKFTNQGIVILLSIIFVLFIFNMFYLKPVYYSQNCNQEFYVENCTDCPKFAFCSEGYFKCRIGYDRQGDQCVQQKQFTSWARQFGENEIKELEQKYGQNKCDGINTKPYKSYEQILSEAKQILLDSNFDITGEQYTLYFENVRNFFEIKSNQKEYKFKIDKYEDQKTGFKTLEAVIPMNIRMTLKCQAKIIFIRHYQGITLFFAAFCMILTIILKYKSKKRDERCCEEIFSYLIDELQKKGELFMNEYDQILQDEYGSRYNKRVMTLVDNKRKETGISIYQEEGEQYVWVRDY